MTRVAWQSSHFTVPLTQVGVQEAFPHYTCHPELGSGSNRDPETSSGGHHVGVAPRLPEGDRVNVQVRDFKIKL